MDRNKSYHPSIIVNDHFEELINRIDIETEMLLEDQSLNEETRNELNNTRTKQLEKIKEIQELNLVRLPKFYESEFMKNWSHLINDATLEYEQKIDLIKEDLIAFDCVLVEDFKSKSRISLLITSWYFNLKSLDFLRFESNRF
jgi:hypothetical protein